MPRTLDLHNLTIEVDDHETTVSAKWSDHGAKITRSHVRFVVDHTFRDAAEFVGEFDRFPEALIEAIRVASL